MLYPPELRGHYSVILRNGFGNRWSFSVLALAGDGHLSYKGHYSVVLRNGFGKPSVLLYSRPCGLALFSPSRAMATIFGALLSQPQLHGHFY